MKDLLQESTLEPFEGMSFAPIPPAEKALQTVEAVPFVQTFDRNADLEGLHFNRDGSVLYFVQCVDNYVCAVDMRTKEVSVVLELASHIPEFSVSAVKVHRDGRLFVACVNQDFSDGGVFYMQPDGTDLTVIARDIVADDLVFDHRGGIYVTDMRGTPTNLTGGILYLEPETWEHHTVLSNLAAPNGITLSVDGHTLWVTDTACGTLLRSELSVDGLHTLPMHQTISYRTTGFMGPDSLTVDNEDNVYCAFYFQGRVMVFNRYGWPVGQVLMPDRDKGKHLRTTHPFIRPGTRELYICTNDPEEGAWIFCAGSFAQANENAFYLS